MKTEFLPWLYGINKEMLFVWNMADNICFAGIDHIRAGNLHLSCIVTIEAAINNDVSAVNVHRCIKYVKGMPFVLHATLRRTDQIVRNVPSVAMKLVQNNALLDRRNCIHKFHTKAYQIVWQGFDFFKLGFRGKAI